MTFATVGPGLGAFHAFVSKRGRLARIALYVYAVLITCPTRYWPLGTLPEETWRFALNYAPANGLAAGRDVIFTCGPLVYLLFPQHLGSNLKQGLFFQTLLWLILAAILADVFFRSRFPLRNLAMCSFFLGLAAPLFWFNYLGTENLMLAGALLLVLTFHLRGSMVRYVAALVLVGLLPLFKLTAGMVGFAALAGFQIERLIRCRWKALPEVVLTALVPLAVMIAVGRGVMPSFAAILSYLRGGAEIASGFSAAMSTGGPHIEIVSALEAIALLVILLFLHAAAFPGLAKFYAWLIVLPLFLSLKHGFVRQDIHIVNFFCFAALTLALVSLTISLQGNNVWRVLAIAAVFFIIWQDNVGRLGGMSTLAESTGARSAQMLWGALRFDLLLRKLDASIETFPRDLQIEPELISIIGNSSVASLSSDYNNLAAARLQIRLYPVVERYAAFTPYLDGLNAAWIRDQGPRFLVFDGKTIDARDLWAETPAMWLEIYRWYDSRFLSPNNLLLERRALPRFSALETIDRFPIAFPGELRLPVSQDPVFWTMNCNQSLRGRFQKLFFRLKSVFIIIHEAVGATRSARIIPDLLVSPVLGNYLPGSLSQLAALFHPGGNPPYSVDRIAFEGPGSASYSPSCQVEILRPAR